MLALSIALGVPFHEVRTWSAAEITLYQAYFRVQPFGDQRGDILHALSMAQTANLNRGKREPYDWREFLPFEKREQRGGVNEVRNVLRSLSRKKVN